ncbi:hypothetical protein KY361_02510 [Candidatus Woesearchaeota archaeon]|nr:hypothetical protein [Candidatus Woesearchaeota archaeon]
MSSAIVTVEMKFNREMSKKERKKLREQQIVKEEPEEPGELEESVEEVEKEAAEEAPSEEKGKSEELYETDKGEAVLKYEKAPEKKGYCELRERTKAVYGIKYAAGKGVDLMKKAKAAIMDWCFVLPRKGSAERKQKEELL